MEIEEAIRHCHEVADAEDCQMMCAADHRWLAERLEEVKRLREAVRWRDCVKEPPPTDTLVIVRIPDAPRVVTASYNGYDWCAENVYMDVALIHPTEWLPIPQKGGEV